MAASQPSILKSFTTSGHGLCETTHDSLVRLMVATAGLLLVARLGLAGAAPGFECIIAPPQPSRVPNSLRQGEFLSPQSVSALAISPDGRQLAVTTMAFRHDRNFWLLADDGRVLWGRYLEPWAPGQVAFLPQGKRSRWGWPTALHGPKPNARLV
jgi:hypothetical protein